MDEAFIARFWSKVDKSGGPDACWPWRGSRDRDGYGDIRDGGQNRRKAHRVAWMLAHGDIPNGLCVLHRCDIRACLNPAHLFLGTQADNMRDMKAKGRARRGPCLSGESSPCAKLTAHGIAAIRLARAAGATYTDIAKAHGVHRRTIARAFVGATYRADHL